MPAPDPAPIMGRDHRCQMVGCRRGVAQYGDEAELRNKMEPKQYRVLAAHVSSDQLFS